MKIAVTGATGHVGANMCRGLLDAGHEVTAVYRTEKRLKALAGVPLKLIQGDVLDPAFLKKAFEGMDAVVNLAAVISINGDKSGMVMRTNTEGPRNVAAACLHNGIQKLIHFSSIHAYKYKPTDPVVDENTPVSDHTSFPYEQSKAAGEKEVLKAVEKGLDATILNPTGILGPHDYEPSRMGAMLRDLYKGKLPTLVQGGFDWVDVRDLIQATLSALENGGRGEKYLVSGRYTTVKELAQIAGQVTGKKLSKVALPVWVAMLGLPFLQFYAKITGTPPLYTYDSLMYLKNATPNISHAKATQDLNYQPRPLEETLKDVYAWFEQEGII